MSQSLPPLQSDTSALVASLQQYGLYPPITDTNTHSITRVGFHRLTNKTVLGVTIVYKNSSMQAEIIHRLCGPSTPLPISLNALKSRIKAVEKKRIKFIKNRRRYQHQLDKFYNDTFWPRSEWPKVDNINGSLVLTPDIQTILASTWSSSASLSSTMTPSPLETTSPSSTSEATTSSSNTRYSKATQTVQDPKLKYLRQSHKRNLSINKNLRSENKRLRKVQKGQEIRISQMVQRKRVRLLQLRQLRSQNILLEKRVGKLKAKCSKLKLFHPPPIPGFMRMYDDRKRTYVPECEECVLTLKKLGVANSKVHSVMTACLNMAHVTYDRLPQETYVNKTRKKLHDAPVIEVSDKVPSNL